MANSLTRMHGRKWARSAKLGRLGVTGAFAVATLIIIFVAGWILDRRGASAADQRLARLARETDTRPLDMIVRAARANRIVFLSDIHNSVVTKQLAAEAIQKMATSSGLDAVIVEVGIDQQPYIDQYFDHTPEDASILMAHPRTIREPGAATRAYIDVYHTIWKINEKLGADRRIRVIAADLEGWPQSGAISPAETAKQMAGRSKHMQDVVEEKVLGPIPAARILVFMTGFNVLKGGALTLQTAGTPPVRVTPLAERLAASTDEVYSFLVDAPSVGVTSREIAPYIGTRVAGILKEQDVDKRFAATITTDFDYLKHPIIEKNTPGLDIAVVPRDYHLRDVADAYVNLP